MFKECIRVHNVKDDGSQMRPSTPTPDKHWAYMLALHYSSDHVQVRGSNEPDGGPELHVCKKFSKEDPTGFEHIMKFINRFDLTYTIERNECSSCSKHPQCVSNNNESRDVD